MDIQIRHSKAQSSGNSRPIAKIWNAAVADLGFKMRVHELLEVPLSKNHVNASITRVVIS